MWKLAIDVSMAAFILTILVITWRKGRSLHGSGLRVFSAGIFVIGLAAIVDITDNIRSLDKYAIVGNTPYAVALKDGLYFVGAALMFRGIVSWIQATVKLYSLQEQSARKLSELNLQLQRQQGEFQALAAEHTAAQERERLALAMEVHDRLAQTLVGMYHLLQALQAQTAGDAVTKQRLERLESLALDAIRESRGIINDLYPPGLAEFGLATLIGQELDTLGSDLGCQTRIGVEGPPRMPVDTELTAYRICHEAIMNIRRHARTATEVDVSLEFTDSALSLTVKDNGPGFDSASAMQCPTFGGLKSIYWRAKLAGGNCEVKSVPNRGTTVAASLPVRSFAKEAP